jgi:hypothetical protein
VRAPGTGRGGRPASRRLTGLLLALALVPALPRAGEAWGGEGHRIVCEIAWKRMGPAARELVATLLRGTDEEWFARTCTWADEVRSTTHRHTAAYHYVNVPAGVPGIDMERDCGDPERRCVVWAVRHYARVLEDAGRPIEERREALKFVAHFVGDLHQPLHAARPEDLGGNRVPVAFFGDRGPEARPFNLHGIWDSAILRHGGVSWPASVDALDERITPLDVQRWQDLDVLGWANESYRIADAFAYPALPPDGVVATAYFLPALAFSEVRLQQAGVRLAHLLDVVAAGTIPEK